MSNRKETAGKTASKSAKGARRGTWKFVIKGGCRVLRSPDGRYYYGTAAEVREARLSPFCRKSLANSIRFYRDLKSRAFTRDEITALIREARCNTIRHWSSDCQNCGLHYHSMGGIPVALELLSEAAARYMGVGVNAFAVEWTKAAIAATQSEAQSSGLDSLPLTRYERRALSALGFDAERLKGCDGLRCEALIEDYVCNTAAGVA